MHNRLRGVAPARFDLVIAADVLVYIGALEALFREAAHALCTGGWFAFSTEECTGVDYTLLPTGRYAQSQAYIRRVAEAAFSVSAEETAVIRMESGIPIAGRLYLLQKQ